MTETEMKWNEMKWNEMKKKQESFWWFFFKDNIELSQTEEKWNIKIWRGQGIPKTHDGPEMVSTTTTLKWEKNEKIKNQAERLIWMVMNTTKNILFALTAYKILNKKKAQTHTFWG